MRYIGHNPSGTQADSSHHLEDFHEKCKRTGSSRRSHPGNELFGYTQLQIIGQNWSRAPYSHEEARSAILPSALEEDSRDT